MSRINVENGMRVSGFGLRAMAFAAMLAPCALFAGNWTLSGGVLTSSDGQWSFSGASRSGTTLTVGACTSAAADGILDFRDIYVGSTKITSLKTTNNAWKTAAIKEFYCDCLNYLGQGLFADNTTLEKFHVTTSSCRSVNINTFSGCTSLKHCVFENCQPTTFLASCFKGCTALESDVADIVSPNTTAVNANAFQNCRKLKGCLVLNRLSGAILGYIFNNTGIQELRLCSDSVTAIKSASCFAGCTSLTNVVISSANLTDVAYTGKPFSDNTALEAVTFNLPNLRSISTSAQARMFNNCSSIKKVTILNEPWQDASGNDIAETFLSREVLYSVGAVAATTDKAKKCTVYALRKDWKNQPYVSPLTGDYEPKYKPPKCYGVYVASTGSAGRKAYMAQLPDYRPGFIISAK